MKSGKFEGIVIGMLTLSSSSSIEFSLSNIESSSGKPVIFIGPFGITSSVYLNCATNSPAISHISMVLYISVTAASGVFMLSLAGF